MNKCIKTIEVAWLSLVLSLVLLPALLFNQSAFGDSPKEANASNSGIKPSPAAMSMPPLPAILQNKLVTLQPGDDDTTAINNALSEVSKAGGGTVKLASGTYSCKTIHLKSNVILQLNGATITAINGTDGPEPNTANEKFQDFGHTHFSNGFIVGENISNCKILGTGTITGGDAIINDSKNGADKMFSLKLCNNIEIGGLNENEKLTFISWGHFAILATGCDGLSIHDCKTAFGPRERDFIDIMECSNVDAYNISAHSGDDVFKIGSDYSLGMKRACHNIHARNIQGDSGCNVCMIGSETTGDISNVTFEDITVNGAGKAGVGITTNDGSVLSDINVRNITMKKVESPIFIKVANRGRCPNPQLGKIKNINITNVTARDCGAYAIIISGFKGNGYSEIEDVKIDNLKMIAKGGHPVADASINPPELNDGNFNMRNIGPEPSYGVWARYFKNLIILNSNLSFAEPDGRYSIVADSGSQLMLDNVSMQKGDAGYYQTKDVTGVVIKNCPGVPSRF